MSTTEEIAERLGVSPPAPAPALVTPGDQVTLELVKLIGIVMTREHETRREYIGQILNDLDELKRNYQNLEAQLREFINGQPTE